MVKMGTRWETPDNAGISNLVQLMLVRGTDHARRRARSSRRPTRMGGSIEATGDVDYSEIAATALSRHWVEMLELVADVRPPPHACRTASCRRCATSSSARSATAATSPTTSPSTRSPRALFGRHPYAWDPLGLKESVERLDRDALLAHYRRHYVPGGMVLAVSGRVKTAEVVAQAARLFGAMPAGTGAGGGAARARPRRPRGARRAWCPARRRRS